MRPGVRCPETARLGRLPVARQDLFGRCGCLFPYFHLLKFVAYKVKDAIVDWFNEKYEKRPSVSVTNPDLVFNIHIAHNKCALSLDSSGESLHKRGYRVAQTEAPLNGVAAGMIRNRAGVENPPVDPMCGSGTADRGGDDRSRDPAGNSPATLRVRSGAISTRSFQ